MKAKVFFLSLMCLICGSVLAQEAPAADLEFNERVHDFGQINEENGKVTTFFEFTNLTNVPLTLTNVRASCGCTTPQWSKEPIAPGKKGVITVTYNPKGRPGNFNKSITLTYVLAGDTESKTAVVNIRGEVIPAPKPEPAQ
ncbi:MAG: DUF1573 domain-containing protein [Paludibacteraceae bacterium]|nr:DUF1573 domain-containing protein [Paludibacteraceae bacterium]